VSEQPVFWLGGAPGKSKNNGRTPPEAERYEPALRDACSACGYEVDEYVAAQGGFGGWLAHLDRSGTRYRVFWSGRSNQLSLEQAHDGGGWNELRSAEVGDKGLPGFVEALKTLLTDQKSTPD
jgi:hypothetical protein